jgi:hypothetical protein
MRFPIAIEPGDDAHAFGVVVPDLPVLRAVDAYAKRHGETRSGFLARAALMAMRGRRG